MSVLVFPFDSATNLTGLTSGDTYDATSAAANAAVLTAACSAGGYYRVPESGTYRVDTAAYAALVTKPTIIAGPKSGTATLQSGPDTAVADSTMFKVVSGGSLTLLAGGNLIGIAGPPNVVYGTDIHFADTIQTFGVRTQDATALDIDGASLTKWTTPLKMEAGGTVAARNSILGGRVVGVLCIEGTAPSSLVVDNCDIALESDYGNAIGQTHNFYIERGVDLSISNSRFTKAGNGTFSGFGVLAGYAGVGTPLAQRKISGCSFSGMTTGVYTGSTGSTKIDRCTFDLSGNAFGCQGIRTAGVFECVGSNFIGPASHVYDMYGALDDQNLFAAGTFTGCKFDGTFIYMVRRQVSGSTGLITINRCYVGTGFVYSLGADAGCGRILATNTDFELLAGDIANSHPNNLVSLVNCTRGGANTFSGNG